MGAQRARLRREIVLLGKETIAGFQRHKAQWLAAAIAYFTVFAIAPLIIVIVEIAGVILGQHRGVLDTPFTVICRRRRGNRLLTEFARSSRPRSPKSARVRWRKSSVGLSLAWRRSGFSDRCKKRSTPCGTSNQGSAASWTCCGSERCRSPVSSASRFSCSWRSGPIPCSPLPATPSRTFFRSFRRSSKLADFVLSFALIMALFGLLFKFLPECEIAWADVWLGAAATALLFVVGQFLLGWYLGRTGISSTYGAFGALVVFLVWVNYSAQIMLLGAEFTHVYAKNFGSVASKTTTAQTGLRRSSAASA